MAMSLGRHSGAALIGRPLDIVVQAVLEAQDDVSGQCLGADVFYGDVKLANSRVNVTIEKSAVAPSQALIRIRSNLLVDEPIVTFYLRAGCQLKTERRYVILAELASDAATVKNIPTPMPSGTSVTSARTDATPPFDGVSSSAQASTPNAANAVERRRSRAPLPESRVGLANAAPADSVSSAKPSGSSNTAQSRRAAKSDQARLKLEPLDLAIERDPRLKSSSELLSTPAVDPRARAAASALWRALSAQPEDILRDTEKLKTLENSVLGLQTQNKKGLLSIDDLNVKVKQAEAERYANVLVYALLALLLAAVAGLVFLFRQRSFSSQGKSGDKPWWRKSEAYDNQQAAWSASLLPAQKDGLGLDRPVSAPASRPVDMEVDIDLEAAGSGQGGNRSAPSSNFFEAESSEPKFSSDFGPSMHSSRTAKAEELFDVQQQADFFVSIGQQEQAIELLQNHIAENPETSALIHLDLFNLYHQLQRPADYDRLRETFNQRFNAKVPTFELYTAKSIGLESYPLALSRIEALWPSAKVLEVIEESLFRRPDTQAEAFNLEAYRELLLLYSVAKDVDKPKFNAAVAAGTFDLPDRHFDSVESRPMNFMPTAIQPLSAIRDLNQHAGQNMAAGFLPSYSPIRGLDIDLGELSAMDNESESDSASDAQFFAQFDSEATSPLPDLGSAPVTLPVKGFAAADNLIDFEDFDVLDVASREPKPPRA